MCYIVNMLHLSMSLFWAYTRLLSAFITSGGKTYIRVILLLLPNFNNNNNNDVIVALTEHYMKFFICYKCFFFLLNSYMCWIFQHRLNVTRLIFFYKVFKSVPNLTITQMYLIIQTQTHNQSDLHLFVSRVSNESAHLVTSSVDNLRKPNIISYIYKTANELNV